MELPNYVKNYQRYTKELLQTHDRKQAMSLAVGGEFDAIGKIEYSILVKYGLQKQHTIVDVGCGSGRLAFQLREFLTGEYIGTDVVPDLYEYAQEICGRPDWKFLYVTGLTIPAPDNYADFVCFFSVFTHLLHEESYKYLKEAKRVIKPGGKIIFSFLEFSNPDHWQHFQGTLPDDNPDRVRNYFISRDAIQAWAEHLNLQILEIVDGGQSVCVLTKT